MSGPGQIRIIAGQWRSRKLKVLDRQGLRPTPDRVRETLFNWLQMAVPGSYCLDLFAGSGALGFEAASRGAAAVVMLEQDAAIVAVLQANARQLDAEQIQIRQTDCINSISRPLPEADRPYDIVFIDPPYHSGLAVKCCQLLESGHWLSDNARVYIECDIEEELHDLPANWTCSKSRRAGRVGYYLYTRSEGPETGE